jgi:hypothetical protein
LASYRAIAGVLDALKDLLEARMTGGLDGVLDTPSVKLLGTTQLEEKPSGNALGVYLHRISVDPFGRNRYLQPSDPARPRQPELPINLHLLLIGWSDKATNEGTLLGWGMQQIGASLDLDISHLGIADSDWGEGERLQVQPEDMSTEDLLRIWDGLPRDYLLSAPYLVKTLRLKPEPAVEAGEPVTTIATPVEVL